jgi:hypothetical protein
MFFVKFFIHIEKTNVIIKNMNIYIKNAMEFKFCQLKKNNAKKSGFANQQKTLIKSFKRGCSTIHE